MDLARVEGPGETLKTSQIPDGHRLEKTADGSLTLYSQDCKEACHSYSGARGESIYNFVEGCQIVARGEACQEEARPLRILEVGLGLGHGVMATFDALKQCPHLQVDFVTTECNPQLVDYARQFWGKLWPREKVTILQGDARQALPLFLKTFPRRKFEAIYQDPFSPRSNPQLWTAEWFALLKQLSQREAILATYSSASAVRAALTSAGWEVEKRPGFAGKRESLIARPEV